MIKMIKTKIELLECQVRFKENIVEDKPNQFKRMCCEESDVYALVSYSDIKFNRNMNIEDRLIELACEKHCNIKTKCPHCGKIIE